MGCVVDVVFFFECIIECFFFNVEVWVLLLIVLVVLCDWVDCEWVIEVVEWVLSFELDNVNGFEHWCLLFSWFE